MAEPHVIHVTPSIQLFDLNAGQNKCIVTFQLVPSDPTIPFDIAVVSQSIIDSEAWNAQTSSFFKRFSGTVSQTVEIDDDHAQQYYIALRSAPGIEDPLALSMNIMYKPSETYQPPAPLVETRSQLDNTSDEVVLKWYQTTWGMFAIVAAIAAVGYLIYRYVSNPKKKVAQFEPVVSNYKDAQTYNYKAPSEPVTVPVSYKPSYMERSDIHASSEYRSKPKKNREKKKEAPVSVPEATVAAPSVSDDAVSVASSESAIVDMEPVAPPARPPASANRLSSKLLAKLRSSGLQ